MRLNYRNQIVHILDILDILYIFTAMKDEPSE